MKGQLSPLDLNNTPPDNPESAVPRLHLGVLLGARPTTLLCWGPLSPRRSSPATPRGAGALRSPRSPRFPASSRRPASCASPGPIKRRRSGKSCCPRDQANAPSLSLLLSDTLRGRSDVDMTRPGVYRVVWQRGTDMSNELFVKVMPPPAADASPAPAGPAERVTVSPPFTLPVPSPSLDHPSDTAVTLEAATSAPLGLDEGGVLRQ